MLFKQGDANSFSFLEVLVVIKLRLEQGLQRSHIVKQSFKREGELAGQHFVLKMENGGVRRRWKSCWKRWPKNWDTQQDVYFMPLSHCCDGLVWVIVSKEC